MAADADAEARLDAVADTLAGVAAAFGWDLAELVRRSLIIDTDPAGALWAVVDPGLIARTATAWLEGIEAYCHAREQQLRDETSRLRAEDKASANGAGR